MQRSPRVEIKERVIETIIPSNPGKAVAVIGFSGKGPENTPIEVGSFREFQRVFGEIDKNDPYGYISVRKIFTDGERVIFYRITSDDATNSTVEIDEDIDAKDAIISFESQNVADAINGTELAVADVSLSLIYGTETYSFTIPTVEDTENPEAYVVEQSTVREVLKNNENVEKISGVLKATLVNSGEIVKNDVSFEIDGVPTLIDFNVDFAGSETKETAYVVDVISKEKGESTGLISIQKTERTNEATGITSNDITVFYNELPVETFGGVSLRKEDEDSDLFFANRINNDPENGGSEYIKIYVSDKNNAGEEAIIPKNQVIELTGGSNGSMDEEAKEDAFIRAVSLNSELANQDLYDFEVIITPDVQSVEVDYAVLALCENVEAFYVLDSELGYTTDLIKDWHNGNIPGGAAFDNSFGALYWPWLKDFSIDTREYLWVPPSVFMAAKYIQLDKSNGPWMAPAGDTRGRVGASDLEHSPNITQRDNIYGGENAVNPFVFFNSKGILAYGQKTLLRDELNPLNRINVRRTVIHIRKQIRRRMEELLFEPNNTDTWRRAYRAIVDILAPIKENNGLADYRVIIDERVNSPADIQQGIMNGLITLIPEGTIEEIKLNINVQSSGTTITEE